MNKSAISEFFQMEMNIIYFLYSHTYFLKTRCNVVCYFNVIFLERKAKLKRMTTNLVASNLKNIVKFSYYH